MASVWIGSGREPDRDLLVLLGSCSLKRLAYYVRPGSLATPVTLQPAKPQRREAFAIFSSNSTSRAAENWLKISRFTKSLLSVFSFAMRSVIVPDGWL
jgi:hypothetical protein